MGRLSRLLALIALAAPLPSIAEATLVESPAFAEEENDAIAVGTALVATADVTLHKADIAKGSRVSVTKLLM
ncbi:MAG: hypothetical protein U0359_41280, partial [Byssovorax sp.]